MKPSERARAKLTPNEEFFFQTLYYTLRELLRVAQHLNLRECAGTIEELLDELEDKLQPNAAAESSE